MRIPSSANPMHRIHSLVNFSRKILKDISRVLKLRKAWFEWYLPCYTLVNSLRLVRTSMGFHFFKTEIVWSEESLFRMISSLLYASKFVKVGSAFYGFSLFQDRNSISQVIYLIIFSLHGSIFRTKICIKVKHCERTIKLDSSFSSRPELKYNKKLWGALWEKNPIFDLFNKNCYSCP